MQQTLDEVMKELNELNNKQQELQKIIEKISNKNIDYLREISLTLFSMTNIIGYTWCQYTPYFNDGDSCTFGIGEVYVTTKDEINSDMDNDSIIDYIESNYEATIDDIEHNENIDKDSLDKVTQMLFSLIYEESIALNTFGDHMQITVYQSTDGDIKLESKYFEHD